MSDLSVILSREEISNLFFFNIILKYLTIFLILFFCISLSTGRQWNLIQNNGKNHNIPEY